MATDNDSTLTEQNNSARVAILLGIDDLSDPAVDDRLRALSAGREREIHPLRLRVVVVALN